MRILVLGADGFIGRRLVAALGASDWAVPVAAGRRPRPPDPAHPVERVVLDATDRTGLANAMQGVDGVVNCVAGDAATIVANARALFGSATEGGTPRIVHLSSMAVYGSAVGTVDEDAPLKDDQGAYGAAKTEAERLAAAAPDVVVLRPGCVYGADSPQWTVRIAGWLADHRIGDLGANGDGWCNLVHVDDVVQAVGLALRTPAAAGHAFNLAMAAPPTWNEYFVRFGIALGAVPVSRIAARRLKIETKLLAPPLKIAEIVAARLGLRGLRLPEPIPPSLAGLWRQEIRLSTRKSEAGLGLGPPSCDAGRRESAATWRAKRARA